MASPRVLDVALRAQLALGVVMGEGLELVPWAVATSHGLVGFRLSTTFSPKVR
jgi:hypothetical protein